MAKFLGLPGHPMTLSVDVHPQWSISASGMIRRIAYWEPAALHLTEHFRAALRTHFAGLSAEDLHLRFGTHCRPEVLDSYVAGIDFSGCTVLGVFDAELQLVGAAHISPDGAGWELGLSVLTDWRRRGVGTLLLRRAMQQARLAEVDRISVHCLSENQALMRLVRKVGAEVVESNGESDGIIVLPRTLLFDRWDELAEEQIATFNFGWKAQRLLVRRWIRQVHAAQIFGATST